MAVANALYVPLSALDRGGVERPTAGDSDARGGA